MNEKIRNIVPVNNIEEQKKSVFEKRENIKEDRKQLENKINELMDYKDEYLMYVEKYNNSDNLKEKKDLSEVVLKELRKEYEENFFKVNKNVKEFNEKNKKYKEWIKEKIRTFKGSGEEGLKMFSFYNNELQESEQTLDIQLPETIFNLDDHVYSLNKSSDKENLYSDDNFDYLSTRLDKLPYIKEDLEEHLMREIVKLNDESENINIEEKKEREKYIDYLKEELKKVNVRIDQVKDIIDLNIPKNIDNNGTYKNSIDYHVNNLSFDEINDIIKDIQESLKQAKKIKNTEQKEKEIKKINNELIEAKEIKSRMSGNDIISEKISKKAKGFTKMALVASIAAIVGSTGYDKVKEVGVENMKVKIENVTKEYSEKVSEKAKNAKNKIFSFIESFGRKNNKDIEKNNTLNHDKNITRKVINPDDLYGLRDLTQMIQYESTIKNEK